MTELLSSPTVKELNTLLRAVAPDQLLSGKGITKAYKMALLEKHGVVSHGVITNEGHKLLRGEAPRKEKGTKKEAASRKKKPSKSLHVSVRERAEALIASRADALVQEIQRPIRMAPVSADDYALNKAKYNYVFTLLEGGDVKPPPFDRDIDWQAIASRLETVRGHDKTVWLLQAVRFGDAAGELVQSLLEGQSLSTLLAAYEIALLNSSPLEDDTTSLNDWAGARNVAAMIGLANPDVGSNLTGEHLIAAAYGGDHETFRAVAEQVRPYGLTASQALNVVYMPHSEGIVPDRYELFDIATYLINELQADTSYAPDALVGAALQGEWGIVDVLLDSASDLRLLSGAIAEARDIAVEEGIADIIDAIDARTK